MRPAMGRQSKRHFILAGSLGLDIEMAIGVTLLS
jgi:hypothetical protein